ncbi:MAG TPA: hypothetical protein VL968_10900 [Rhodocyclaceae bacterium]|nr:hypothetical protein [Rhodocyclaceae bacterium]
MENYPMWATAIELGIPALLLFALWRVWPKEGAEETEGAESQPQENPDTPVVDQTQNHDHSPR